MLTAENNAVITQTDSGTPMGELFRRYWIPALLSEELPDPDCPPVRVKLLGEELIAFRDSDGRVGLLDEFCAHRTASLFFGRNEECGLRCAYHGWKYDVDGNVVDMPSEPEDSSFKGRLKQKAYPTFERCGVIWTHMGAADIRPPLPEFEWTQLDIGRVFVSKRFQFSNYLQAMEGGIDSSHISFAHRYNLDAFNVDGGDANADFEGYEFIRADTHPKFEVVQSDGGLLVGARRRGGEGKYYWRITQWIMPCFTVIPPSNTYNPMGSHAWVPIDDYACWAWSWDYHPTRDLTAEELAHFRSGGGLHALTEPVTYKPLANAANDYLIDREAQRQKLTFSGVHGIAAQDFSLQESMGRVADRTRERLGTSDAGIVLARRRLLALIKDEEAKVLPGQRPAEQQVRSAAILLPEGVSFQEGAADALRVSKGRDFVAL